MFDFVGSELVLIGIVSLILIGPKDMPIAIRTVTGLIKKVRRMMAEFQGHFDEMVKEADLEEARDQWRELRNMNVKNKILKTLDEDGSIEQSLKDIPTAHTAFHSPNLAEDLSQKQVETHGTAENTIDYKPKVISKPMAIGLAAQNPLPDSLVPDQAPDQAENHISHHGHNKGRPSMLPEDNRLVTGFDVDEYGVLNEGEGKVQNIYASAYGVEGELSKEDIQCLQEEDPAPVFIPPEVALGLQRHRKAPPPPVFIPPSQAAFIEDMRHSGRV
ncbi:Sec-independent protein translocase protein TatB [Entomobacter blattae]|uniref:Sec-independent protein translocase protein TatB n=1 Tax=Entomobacter blattae TaxID=2762277 RepID=A0A7H1NUB1_9PROT|nr:Sec-independent protein translocase protein TatB [Entomobacter blattae]QNT79371.1 Sec-independent protein translocase protein TatB [Entomobacter blattae]